MDQQTSSSNVPTLTTGDFARADGASYRSTPYEVPNAAGGLNLAATGLGLTVPSGALQDWNSGVDGGIALYAQRDSSIDADAVRQLALAQQRATLSRSSDQARGAWSGRTNQDVGQPITTAAAASVAATASSPLWDTLGRIDLSNVPGVGWLSQSQAMSSAQYWQGRLDATGNPVYAVAQGVASLWADHSQEVGMALASVRGVESMPINGITDATVGVRGSSVTGYSLTKGTQFGPKSDVDFWIESEALTAGRPTSPNIDGMVAPGRVMRDFPELKEWSSRWTDILGRKVSPAGFQPGKLPDQPTIVVR